MNIAKSLLLVALNLTLNNQAAFADSPMTDIFNLKSNPQELKSDEIVSCNLFNASKGFQIKNAVIPYAECKINISKKFKEAQSDFAKECLKDIRISASLFSLRIHAGNDVMDEKGEVLLKCDKSVQPPVVELTIEQKLQLALKENAALKNQVVGLNHVVDSKNKQLEIQRKSIDSLKLENSELYKKVEKVITDARKSIEQMQQMMKSMQLTINKMLSERQQLKQQIAELLRKQSDRMPSSADPVKKIEAPVQQVVKK